MERSLLFLSLALSAITLALLRYLPEPTSSTSATLPRRGAMAGGLFGLAVAGFVLTLPTTPPFHAGGMLGLGFALGAVLVALGTLLNGTPGRQAIALAAPAPAAVALALLLLRPSLLDGLLGVALGWLAALLLAGALDPGLRRDAQIAGGFGVALVAVAALGILRDGVTPELAKQSWSTLAVVLGAAALPLALLARALPRFGPWLVAAVLGLALHLLNRQLTFEPKMLWLGLTALGLGALALWVRRPTALALLLTLAATLVGTQMLQGYGAGLAALALWLAFFLVNPTAPETGRVPLFGTLLALAALLTARFRPELRGAQLSDQYALLGLLVGASLPQLGGTLVERRQGVLPTALTALLAVGVPAALTVIFGPKCLVAYLPGLALGTLVSAEVGLLPLVSALATAQFVGHWLPGFALARVVRVEILAAGIVVLLLLTLVVRRLSATEEPV
jgi:hypothetical protein